MKKMFKSFLTRIWWTSTTSRYCPGGTSDNSPTFQRWEQVPGVTLVPKGRPNEHTVSVVPSGLRAFYDQLPNVETLGYCRTSLREEDEIQVALDRQTVSRFSVGTLRPAFALFASLALAVYCTVASAP